MISSLRFKNSTARDSCADLADILDPAEDQNAQAHADLPEDFCWQGYIAAHGDLWLFRTEHEALHHYINYGRAERRSYQREFDAAFFRKLYHGANSPLSDEQLERIWRAEGEVKYANLRELLWTSGFTRGLWPAQFDAQSYVVYNNLQADVRNDIQAIAHFLTVGMPAMLAISPDLEFDPAFRRAFYKVAPESSLLDMYRHWVEFGLPQNEAANERHFLKNLGLHLHAIPEGFLWQKYFAEQPHLNVLAYTKWHAFEHFVQYGVLEGGPLPLTRDASGPVLLAIADRFVLMGRTEDADRLYERIMLSDDPIPTAWQHAGDNAIRAGQHARALNMYGRVEKAGAASFWTYCNFVTAAMALGDLDLALQWLEKALPIFPRNQRLLDWHHAILGQQLHLAIQGHIARTRSHIGNPHEAGQVIESEIGRIYQGLLGKYEIQFGKHAPLRRIIPHDRPLRVAILANLDLPQCTYYRVTQKCEQLKLAGAHVEMFVREDILGFKRALATADIAIFYRLAANIDVLDCVAHCNYLGVSSVYEIDDLVFDARYYPEPHAAYSGAISTETHFGLVAGVALVNGLIKLCSHGIASTEHLAAHLADRVSSGEVSVHRNGLSPSLAALSTYERGAIQSDGHIRLFYGSGTKAHGADFINLIVPALMRLLAEHQNLIFVACGYVETEGLQEAFPEQVEILPLIENRDAYIWQVRNADINMSVLQRSPFNDCKSEIKWLEPACFGVPSCVSNVGGFVETLTGGEHVILVEATAESWYDSLKSLIVSPALRRRIGEQARLRAAELYSPAIQGQSLQRTLRDFAGLDEVRLTPGQRRRRRILLVNVFYPPQSIGGATRIVRDEACGLAANGEFEVAVLCGNDEHGPAYALTTYWSEGVRVFSINTPPRAFMDWLPEDENISPLMDQVLAYFEPDLVHFHATQRLTVSALAAVQARAIPYVVTLHDAWWISDHQFLMDGRDYLTYPWEPEHYESDSNPHSRAASSARRFKLMAALCEAASVVSVSESFAALYRRAGVPNVAVLQNAVSQLPPLEQIPAPAGKVRIGQIGGMTYHKGFFILKQLLMRGAYDRIELVVVDHAAKPGSVQLERWGATDVRIIGKVPHGQAGWLFGQFDVLVALSTWPESFGLVTREALAYGKWIIASNRGAIGEVVIEGENGYRVDVSDQASVIAAFDALQENPSRFTVPPAQSPDLFGLDQHVLQLSAIYRQAISNTSISAPLGVIA